MARPVFRYFDCRSRGQAIRFALALFGVDFDDQRVPVAELAALRARVKSGSEPDLPFGTLPLLRWEDVRVSETLAIAGYLETRLGPTRTAGERARLDMVCSAAHLDMQAPYRELLWLPERHPDDALRAVARGFHAHLGRRLDQLESLAVRRDDPFFGGQAPSVADVFVYESIDRARCVFGMPFTERLDRAPRMRALAERLAENPAIAEWHREGRVPHPVTASPSEDSIRERLPDLMAPGGASGC